MTTGAQKAVAAVAVLLAIASGALMIEAGRRVYLTIGPSHAVAAADGSLYVVSHGRLHVFGPGGERRDSIELAGMGVTAKPSDIALHADGRIVLADPDTSLLERCRLPKGPCEALDLGLARTDVQQLMPMNSAKIAIDDAAHRYYVSDNAGQALVIADFSGRILARSATGTVWYPNHLFVPAPGELAVVDTNHQRIATFDVRGDRFGGVLRAVAAGSSSVSRPGRRWPFDSAPMPDGGTAVLVADNGMRNADLVLLDRTGKALRRVDLGAGSDPFDIERWGERLVVADASRYELEALDPLGRAVADFPPVDFRAELAEERGRTHRWRLAQQAGRAGLIAVPLLAILVLWRLGIPLTLSAPASPVPGPSAGSARPAGFGAPAEQWIGYDPAFIARQGRRMVQGIWIAAIIVAAGIAVMAWLFTPVLFSHWGLLHLGPQLAFLALAPLLLIPTLRHAARRHASFRMMPAAAGLRIVGAGRGGAADDVTVPWKDVYSDGARILAGKTVVILRTPATGEMFDRRLLDEAVLARIAPANSVTPARLNWQVMRARPRETALAVAVFVVVAGMYAAHRLGLL